MNKFKLFCENLIIYGFGGVIHKIIPLMMAPVVARLMPDTSYYGISDMSGTIVSFGSALAIMGMYDAMYRLFFEQEDMEYKKEICSTTLAYTVISAAVVTALLIVFRRFLAVKFFGDAKYSYIIFISAAAVLVGTANNIIVTPTRMQNKRQVFLVLNAVSPVISYAITIPLLLSGQYIIALPLGSVLTGMVMSVISGCLNHTWFSIKHVNWKRLRPLLVLAVPLLPNFLIYWVFNSCDRLMLTNMVGLGAVGIYSVSAKLGSVSQLIYTAFAGGWQYFAFSTMKESNQVETNSKICEYLGVISFSATMLICACSHLIIGTLFPESYLSGYIAAPYLFLSPLMLMLFQVIANQFLVIKKTWPSMLILLCGAIINIGLNYILIPLLGIEGASIATLMGHTVSFIVCIPVLMKMKLFIMSYRLPLTACIMLVYMTAWRLFFSSSVLTGLMTAAISISIYVCMYRKELMSLIFLTKGILRHKKGE